MIVRQVDHAAFLARVPAPRWRYVCHGCGLVRPPNTRLDDEWCCPGPYVVLHDLAEPCARCSAPEEVIA